MPVIDNSLVTRRANIANSVALLSAKRNLTPQDADLIGRYEEELASIESQIGTRDDERHQQAWTKWLRTGEFTNAQRDSYQLANYHATRLYYRGGKIVGAQPEWRATVGAEGTATPGAFPGSTGGYVVPLPFLKAIVAAAKYTAPWFDIADLQVTATGAGLVMSADNDTSVSAQPINEGAADSASDITLVNTALGAFRWTSRVIKVSNEMIQDTGIDLDSYLAVRLAARMMRGLDPKYTKGAGTTEPLGALTGLTPAFTIVGAGSNDGSSGANTIGSDDLSNLEKALDPAYRPNARWLMHPNTLASLRTVKDKQGHTLFESLNRPEGPVLLGYPVTVAPSMDQLQTSASSPTVTRVPLAFGDFSYYKARLVRPTLHRLDTLYAPTFQTGFVLNWRTDAALVDGASSNRAIVTAQTVY